jgi:arsenate reductase-like glutaredoxin family protein
VEEREPLDAARARDIMLAHPAIIRRPILELGASRHLGFSETDYAALFS